MPRYYFHIHNGTGLTRDEEGQELSGPDEAHDAALSGIRSLLADELEGGEIDLDGRIEITDGAGDAMRTVAFGEAVSVHPAGSKSR
jgi:hypothetical protein